MNFPNCVYIDLTHALFGSGGIARYHINGLVYKVVQSSQITVEDIDKFSASVTVWFFASVAQDFLPRQSAGETRCRHQVLRIRDHDSNPCVWVVLGNGSQEHGAISA